MEGQQPTHVTATGRVWYLQTATNSGGEVHEQRVEYVPGSPFPPEHLHPRQDEVFSVESGQMEFVVAGKRTLVGPGEQLTIPRGTPHQARNASSEVQAIVRWETRPALRTTDFFSTAARLSEPMPLLDAALLAHEFRDVFRLTGPRKFLVPVIGRVARLLGRTLPTE